MLYELGFGLLIIDGIRDLSPLNVEYVENFDICEAAESDIGELMTIENKMHNTMIKSPIFNYCSDHDINHEYICKNYFGNNKRQYLLNRIVKLLPVYEEILIWVRVVICLI